MQLELKSSENYTYWFFNDVPSVLPNLGVMAAKIAYNNFEWRYTTLILFNTMQSFIQAFFMTYKRPVVIKLSQGTPVKFINIKQYVIFGETSADIIRIMRWLDGSEYDRTGRYIIICSSKNVLQCDKNQIFKKLSKLHISNVVALKTAKNGEAAAYSYDVIKPGICYNSEPDRIEVMLNCQNDSCFSNLYPDKFNNIHLCPWLVSAIEEPPYMMYLNKSAPSGFDGDILKMIADNLNATLNIKTPNELEWGRYVNYSWTGSFGDIINNRVDAAICTSPYNPYIHDNFQTSRIYYYNDIVWAARVPSLTPPWEKLLHPLGNLLWIILLLIFIGIVLANNCLKTIIWKKSCIQRNFVLHSWLLFLGMPIHKLPSKKAYLIIIYTWVWFCFIIRYAYQAALFDALSYRSYRQHFKTCNEVFQYPYGGASSLREHYRLEHDVYEKWINLDMNEIYRILDEILDGTTEFIIAGKVDMIKNHVKYYNGTKILQIVPQTIVRIPSVIYFRKDSPFIAPVDRILSTLSETGFIEIAYRKHLSIFSKWRKPGLASAQPFHNALSVEYFAGTFIVLSVGWIVSLSVFAIEVVWGILLKKRHK
ncbi:uncharacterized protein LOC115456398 [Manduca sexta]|uniref:uncharacterized protein LOC115456398 n=1 Tax=Manduca sexta TaxID=7130 RepID=UPI00118427D6|nr:uncharacterized protein LOC115456398 [Manduca sexta]